MKKKQTRSKSKKTTYEKKSKIFYKHNIFYLTSNRSDVFLLLYKNSTRTTFIALFFNFYQKVYQIQQNSSKNNIGRHPIMVK